MQKTEGNNMVTMARRSPQVSTTLNRRYVKRPTKGTSVAVSTKKEPKLVHFSSPKIESPHNKQVAEKVTPHPLQTKANAKVQIRRDATKMRTVSGMSASELKDQAIRKALAAAAVEDDTSQMESSKKGKSRTKSTNKLHFGFGRLVLALSCAAVAVFAIVYFVNLNMPDISLKVAAMQTGINASYPTYVPRDYSISSITSENGKITLDFVNRSNGGAFSLIEEASSWDSNALMTNYVADTFSDNYSMIREQGLTIYVDGSNAAWVNGGIVYKINTTAGELTNKQIRSIAVSL